MDKKITRRVVLGTTIAGLLAGPLVMRAIQKNRIENLEVVEVPPLITTKDLPIFQPPSVRNRFFNEWNTSCQQFLKPLTINENRNIETLKPDLSIEKKWKFLKLNTYIRGELSDLGEYTVNSEQPMYYEIIEGNIMTGSGKFVISVLKNESRIIVSKSNRQTVNVNLKTQGDRIESVTYDSTPIDEIKVESRFTGDLEFIVRDDIWGSISPILDPVLTTEDKNNTERMLCLNMLLPSIRFIYVDRYSINQKIEIPASVILFCDWDIPRIQVVDSFKKLNKHVTVSIFGEQALGSEDQMRSYYQGLVQEYLKQTEQKIWNGIDETIKKQYDSSRSNMMKSFDSRIDQSLEQEKRRFEKRHWLVDIESGLVLQYEIQRRPYDITNGYSTFERFQMIET
jgi:hypothetical protein